MPHFLELMFGSLNALWRAWILCLNNHAICCWTTLPPRICFARARAITIRLQRFLEQNFCLWFLKTALIEFTTAEKSKRPTLFGCSSPSCSCIGGEWNCNKKLLKCFQLLFFCVSKSNKWKQQQRELPFFVPPSPPAWGVYSPLQAYFNSFISRAVPNFLIFSSSISLPVHYFSFRIRHVSCGCFRANIRYLSKLMKTHAKLS